MIDNNVSSVATLMCKTYRIMSRQEHNKGLCT